MKKNKEEIPSAEYKEFSRRLHQKSWKETRPCVCQFELTFACPLHCRYCYTDCYNQPRYIRKELETGRVIEILDKLHQYGILWLCFTGGDPLSRKDFARIYTYAKKKGFIVSVFTSGTLLDKAIISLFKELKPFCVEVTLNTLNRRRQDLLSGTAGSLKKIIAAIRMLKKAGIPFKIKTMVCKDSYHELAGLKDYSAKLGVGHQFSSLIFPRLDGDRAPCVLRLGPEQAAEIEQRDGMLCGAPGNSALQTHHLFRCNAGADSFHIDPYGNMFLCSTMRQPSVKITHAGIEKGLAVFKKLLARDFKAGSACRDCSFWHLCERCPGRAYLEMRDMHAPGDYYCKRARSKAAKVEYGKN